MSANKTKTLISILLLRERAKNLTVFSADYLESYHQVQSDNRSLTDTEGGGVFEQTGVVSYEGQEVHCRRVVVQLNQPTRDGETQIALLTNLPETDAPSVLVAQLYRKRWRVETLFQVATEIFHCEIKTLGYPRAALFSFCMALVAYNLFSTLKGVIALCSW